MRARMRTFIDTMQDQICEAFEQLDGNQFHEDSWARQGGGGGRSRVLQGGQVFEKMGVNVSEVHGVLPPGAIASMAGGLLKKEDFQTEDSRRFFATGLSLVAHPHNPMAPTAHCNYRYFELGESQSPSAWWFGGGADLTPAYLFDEDAQHFHRQHKAACDRHDASYYPRFKKWCDEYFVIVHRKESRGIGGIFFDYLCDREPEEHFAFVQDCARAFVPSYLPLVKRRKGQPFSDDHKKWQALRRGRYVEFNLVYDRGTTFGLKTDGRIESILMSLPLQARWEYCHEPTAGSQEARMLSVLKTPRSWTD